MEFIREIKQSKILKNVFIALMGTILLAVSSKIKIPFYPVPMTMQTLVILFLGIALGWKLGTATIALYLFEGIIGLPVFSGSPEKGVGLVYFTGPTMGYLVGFLFTVYFAGSINFFCKFYIYSWVALVGNFNWLGKTSLSDGRSTIFTCRTI